MWMLSVWKTRKSFDIWQVGDHLFLFVLELANDVERVLSSEPWSFDKHLVLFRRLEGARYVRSLNFTSINFWVQLHGLPMNRLDISMGIQIGKTTGIVSPHGREAKMIAGDFLRVRVEVDVSKPLCRGRKVILDDEEEVWVSFRYEKLPNFCYWCGMFCHDDKDCDIWLSSKGSLPLESQEFGAWMQATPFNLGRKTFCSMLGLEVFQARGSHWEDQNEVLSENTPPPPSSSTTHGEGILMGPIINLETSKLMEKYSPSCPSPKLASNSCIQYNPISSTSHNEHNSFEFQIQEIDTKINKFDGLREVNQDAEDPGG